MKKLNSILLIDDNEHDNFYHEIVIEEANCTQQVLSIQEPHEALAYLLSRNGTSSPFPELVFIDINMPRINGFELLSEYKKLNGGQNTTTKFIMLTTSFNPNDKKRADSFSEIAMFAIKPLNQEKICNALNILFPDFASSNV